MKICKPCEPKTCPILYGLFIEKDIMGSIGEVMKARLLHWFKTGQKIEEIVKTSAKRMRRK